MAVITVYVFANEGKSVSSLRLVSWVALIVDTSRRSAGLKSRSATIL